MRLLLPRVAGTHPPEYSVHKYWARKPADVLAGHLSTLLPRPGLVVDPFCGSGVLLKEASCLGHEVVGADVNPIAVSLSQFTLDPPSADDYVRTAELLLATVTSAIGGAFDRAGRGFKAKQVRYVVHAIVVRCPGCDTEVPAQEASRSGRSYTCPRCSARLRFNRQSMLKTQVLEVVTEDGCLRDPAELERQALWSDTAIPDVDTTRYDQEFVENNRTLTYRGMTTSHLFTTRNMSALALIADEIAKVSNADVRRALELTLTSGLASCSRLIAYRDGMSGGGPAWSVPGFWVPPIHLETNPLNHLRARIKKFSRALIALQVRTSSEAAKAHRVYRADAVSMLDRVAEGPLADLIFLDPPYGDSVPYLEFSALWNAFLVEVPTISDDISVSNRKGDNGGWEYYASKLSEVLAAANRALGQGGRLLITFNNHDKRAWVALIAALQASGFGCADVAYQVPAVVPAKAQFSPSGSYLGDLYSVFERRAQPPIPSELAKDAVHAALQRCASARGGVVARNLASRTAMIELMRSNVRASQLPGLDAWIAEWFDSEGETLRWRGGLDLAVEPLETVVADETAQLLHGRTSIEWSFLVPRLMERLEEFGAPDAVELKALISNSFDIRKNLVARRVSAAEPLFEHV